MTLEQIEKKHACMLDKIGLEIHEDLQARAQELFDNIRKQYPQLREAYTGMGLGAFDCDIITGVYDDGSEGELDGRDLYEWVDCFRRGARKVYNPRGMTEQIKQYLIELVDILEWAANEKTIPDLSVTINSSKANV